MVCNTSRRGFITCCIVCDLPVFAEEKIVFVRMEGIEAASVKKSEFTDFQREAIFVEIHADLGECRREVRGDFNHPVKIVRSRDCDI